MVKHLRHMTKLVKLLVLGVLICIIWGGIWLQSSEHSLNFAKPWILSSLNPPDSPYNITFDELTIDWRRVTKLGTLRVTRVSFATREGDAIAQLPEIFVTIDPIGFLPKRRVLHTVTLQEASMFLTRSVDDVYYLGLEGGDSSISLDALVASFTSGQTPETQKPIALPFRRLVISNAHLRYHNDKTDEDVTSTNTNFHIARRGGKYSAAFDMPFTYQGGEGTMNAELMPNEGRDDYRLDVALKQFPGKLVCTFAPCPEKTELTGMFDAQVRLGLFPNGELGAAWAMISTPQAVLTAPSWFAKPVKLTTSEATVAYDAAGNTVNVSNIKLGLDDTGIEADIKAVKKEDGWYVDTAGKLTRPLDVTQLYKYWPIAMAPDTRNWVTSKLKEGRAETASMQLNLTPADMGDEPISDKALSADVDARDITIDYLPGFPHLYHVDGKVHFTGTTVKIEGNTGTMLGGTKITKAHLWCPELNNWRIPMVATLEADVPAADAAEFLKMKYFTFDDALTLDPEKISGTGKLAMVLKFDSDSGRKNVSADEVYLDEVNYDITANLTNMAQTGIAGGYDVRNLNGELKATNAHLKFNGALALGESGTSDVALSQDSGAPLLLDVKSKAEAGKPGNDFSLSYKSGTQPIISIKGKRLDATAKYEASENSMLKDFPAIKLDIALDQLYLAAASPFNNVKGTLNCTDLRCESASLSAATGKGKVTGTIGRDAAGKRELKVNASDAGAFLKAFDITDRMTGGRLDMRGTYNDSIPAQTLNARLLIQDFNLKNSQILGRIFSIGSLTGLANALTGSGIAFEKLSANISATKGVIGVSDGKANGAAMGITIKGSVDTNTTKLNLKGVVVPAYVLNSMVGKLPIVGHILGGAEGEGLIAFNYSVSGTYADPQVMVNPLSGLTPGFLRGIFGIFDGGAPPAESKEPTDEFYPGENSR